MSARAWKTTVLFLGILLAARPAHADLVWPALFLTQRLWSVPTIAAGLLVELAILVLVYELPVRRAALVDLAMNAASMVAGMFLIPLAGVGWDALRVYVYPALGIGTFNPYAWAATLLMAVAITSVIERLVITRTFAIPVGRGRFLWLCAANAVSVGMAFESLLTDPPPF